MGKLHLPDALSTGLERTLKKSDFPADKGIRLFRPAHHTSNVRGSRLNSLVRYESTTTSLDLTTSIHRLTPAFRS